MIVSYTMIGKEFPHFPDDIRREVGAAVIHGEDDAADLQLGEERGADAVQVWVNCPMPSSARYSHCTGMSTPSLAAIRPFTVSRLKDGGQSMRM